MNVHHPMWQYIHARETIRQKRLAGMPPPWTDDPILSIYKFTNVKRINDRTTQVFLKTYQANSDALPHIALYNCALRRFTGTVAADEYLGWFHQHDTQYIGVAENKCKQAGKLFWTGAYMIRGGAAGVPKYKVVGDDYLRPLWDRAEEIADVIETTKTWMNGYEIMHTVHGFGGSGFMCKEVLQDYILWRAAAHYIELEDEGDWTPIGPGARRGLNRLFARPLTAPINDATGLEEIRAILEYVQPKWEREYPKEQKLTAHDIQFCLCEYDKYQRVALNQGRPRSRYKYGMAR